MTALRSYVGCAGGATGDAGARASADMGAARGRAGRRGRSRWWLERGDGEENRRRWRRARRELSGAGAGAVGIAGIARGRTGGVVNWEASRRGWDWERKGKEGNGAGRTARLFCVGAVSAGRAAFVIG